MPVYGGHRWLGMFVLPERRECQRLVCYCYTNPQYLVDFRCVNVFYGPSLRCGRALPPTFTGIIILCEVSR